MQNTDRLFFSLSTSLNETAITCSSSWCVLLRFVFLILSAFIFYYACSLFFVSHRKRDPRRVFPRDGVKELLGIFCFLSFSLSLSQ